MAAAVPVQELAAPPALEARGVSRILFRNRKFVFGASIFILLLLLSILGSRVLGPQA